MAIYQLGGFNMENTYGVHVEKVKGNLDFLKRKKPTGHNWADEDGVEEYTDSNDIKFEPKTIILYCRLHATTKADFNTKLNNLKIALEASGTLALIIPNPTPTAHTVDFISGGAIQMLTKWNDSNNVGKFMLKFIEPIPARAS